MRVEIGAFLGLVLSITVFLAFLLECCKNRQIFKVKKEMPLEKRKCEVCASVYFVSIFFEFWHCPLCGSVNRERLASKDGPQART
jgi:hypothetical protein